MLLNNFSVDDFLKGLSAGDRIILSRAITLIESKKAEHIETANEILEQILPKTGKSIRIGITGVPGVGKSTFIETFGHLLISKGHKVAVLTIDPTSTMSKGSILGDKTRMSKLSTNPNAFIRPSPSGTHLGGVAQHTRESIFLCEAAGYDIIIVETVGVGQSETAVMEMVDFFLLLMLSGGGDDLQGIKRGIMEIADLVLINKVDGNNLKQGESAKNTFQRALHLFPLKANQWEVPVKCISSINNNGIDQTWEIIQRFLNLTQSNGYFDTNRTKQNILWFHSALRNSLENKFFKQPGIQTKINETEKLISTGSLSVRKAVNNLIPEK